MLGQPEPHGDPSAWLGPDPGAAGRRVETPVLNAAYYALAYGHKYIARGWYNRGMCVQFVFSRHPVGRKRDERSEVLT